MKNRRLKLTLLMLGVLLTSTLFSQVNVKGIVQDASGEPLPMVTIKVKGTNIVTLSDVFGKFGFSVPNDADYLVATYIGFQTQEFAIDRSNTMVISLKDEDKSLTEVVVIGYGSARRKDITGAIASVKMDEIQMAPVANFMDAMGGRVAGVNVTSNEGQPGQESTMTIRGANSLTGSNSPLFVIDGFPSESSGANLISPAEIESMEVLKDASATAIYGSRGANGVVIITTKRAKMGVAQVLYDGNFGSNRVTKSMDVMNPYDYVRLQNEINSGNALNLYLNKGKTIDDYKNIEGTNWQQKLFRNGETQNHLLSISGGDAKTKFLFSGSYSKLQGLVINSGTEKGVGRMVVDHNVNNNLKVGSSLSYSENVNFGTSPSATSSNSSSNYIYSALSYRPILANGVGFENNLSNMLAENDADNLTNPLMAAISESVKTLKQDILSNSYLEYSILPNLKFRSTLGFSKTFTQGEIFNNSTSKSASLSYRYYAGVNGSVSNAYATNWLNENLLTYILNFSKDQNLTLMTGMNEQRNFTKSNGYSSQFLPNENLGVSGLDEGTMVGMSSAASNWSLLSYLSRATYNYKSKYLLTASMRADGSSKFAKGHQWGYFPSAAISWNMKEEKFMKKFEALDLAKIRLSWGLTGNNRVGDFTYLTQIYGGYGYSYYIDGKLKTGTILNNIGNPNLTWETTAQYNLGYDLSFLKNRITFTTDLYRKETYDLLLNANLPGSMGQTSAMLNIGQVRNEGLELSLSTVNFKSNDFTWNTNVNISFNKSTVVELASNQETMITTDGYYIAKVNQPVSQLYGILCDGLYQYSDFYQTATGKYILKDNVPSNGSDRSLIQPGYRKYQDLNNDGVINDKDKTVIGNPNPIHIGGFSNSFRYKWVDLTLFFQWSYGNQVYNQTRQMLTTGNSGMLNMLTEYNDRWSPTNQNAKYARPNNSFATSEGFGIATYAISDFVEDASYLRFKTISLGLNVPTKRLKINSLRLYVSGQNLYTWTNYTGWDPEVSTKGSGLSKGWDFSAYPRALILTAGLKIVL